MNVKYASSLFSEESTYVCLYTICVQSCMSGVHLKVSNLMWLPITSMQPIYLSISLSLSLSLYLLISTFLPYHQSLHVINFNYLMQLHQFCCYCLIKSNHSMHCNYQLYRKENVTKFDLLLTTFETIIKDIKVLSKINWKVRH